MLFHPRIRGAMFGDSEVIRQVRARIEEEVHAILFAAATTAPTWRRYGDAQQHYARPSLHHLARILDSKTLGMQPRHRRVQAQKCHEQRNQWPISSKLVPVIMKTVSSTRRDERRSFLQADLCAQREGSVLIYPLSE